MKRPWHWLPAAWLALTVWLAGAPAGAQIIDRVDVTRDGDSARIDVRFDVQIDYLRHAPPDRGQLITIFFRLIGGEDAAAATLQETRRAPPNDLVPPFEVTYPAQPGPFGAQRRLEVRFRTPVSFRVRPVDNRTIAIFVPLPPSKVERQAAPPTTAPAAPSAAPAPPPTPPGAVPPTPPAAEPPAPVTTPAPAPAPPATPAAPGAGESDRDAEGEMRIARAALEAGKWDEAAIALNRVLNLPPNRFSQEAQELIGLAREKLGEMNKARVEYELYLRLYPDGPGAARVKERLAALPVGTLVTPEPAAAAPAAPYSAWGSVSQYYYGGKSKVQNTTTVVTPATDATTIDKQQFTATDQSQIVTNADVTGRWRQGDYDSRFVFRDQYTWSLLRDVASFNRLSAAYFETRFLPRDVLLRAGRQIGTSSGILGRYDGASASFAVAPDWRVSGVVGSAVDVPAGTRPIFAGAAVDAANLFPQKLPGVGAQVYAIAQRVAGVADRLGLGGEARYFDAQRTAYGTVDYDPLYRVFNIASLQGTWRLQSGTAFNLLADYRRTPTLSLTNVAAAEGTSDIGGLVSARGLSTIRDEAKALTPISRVYLVGVTQPVTPKWQLGLDFRLSSLSGVGATSITPAAPGTGNVFTYTLQAIGTSLTSWQDILVLDASVLHSPTLDGWTTGVNYLFTPWPLWTFQPTFRYYHQTDDQGGHLTRIEPGLRVVYRLRDRFSLEGEFDLERTHSTSALVDDLLNRPFFYIGWHWDF